MHEFFEWQEHKIFGSSLGILKIWKALCFLWKLGWQAIQAWLALEHTAEVV